MKRFTALILLVVLAFSLFACGEEQKAEKYCWNCGEGIAKEASFCEHCGTKLNETQNENTSTFESSEDITSNTESSKPAVEDSQLAETSNEESEESTEISGNESSAEPEKSSEPEQPEHTHSYSKKVTDPTCTEKGYTTYTCSCGDTYKDDETDAKGHSYSKYVCSACDAIDKTHAYEYLVEWVKTNGTLDEDENIKFIIDEYTDTEYSLVYMPDEDVLRVEYIDITMNEVAFSAIYLDTYYYGFGFWGNVVTGYLNAKLYTEESALEYEDYQGNDSDKDRILGLAKTSVNVLLEGLKYCLSTNDIPLSLADLGFISY